MSQILKPKQVVKTLSSGMDCEVEQVLGGGGQGEVYRAKLGGQAIALKWYFPAQATREQETSLLNLVRIGPPTDKFLWPLELARASDVNGFGYIMQLREGRYKSLFDLMTRRIEPSFRALTTAGLELAHSFLQLHSKGLCYRDISFGNVFFDPNTGEVLICDNDNVAVDGADAGVLGTPDFMAPEIVRGEAKPRTRTDRFSLSVLLFYMFHIHHPLYGKKVMSIRCLDLPARTKLCGKEPLFIFDPVDKSNEAVPRSIDPLGEGGANALDFWPIYPKFIRDLFTKSFTVGLHDPDNGRVTEGIWRGAMIRMRDSIIYCPHCSTTAATIENFYDPEALRANGSQPTCWHCKKAIPLPPRIRIGRNVVMLNHDTKLYPHHVDDQKLYDCTKNVAEVARHPTQANVWGLKNLSDEKWVSTSPDGTIREIETGRSVSFGLGTKINFGKVEGEIRI
jgi:serine/threonine protein kinase